VGGHEVLLQGNILTQLLNKKGTRCSCTGFLFYLRAMFKWIGIIAAITLIVACFLPWASIPMGSIDITGMETSGTGFGKPGILHIGLAVIFIALIAINKSWSRRFNLLILALNTAWALRNIIIIPACHMGACPQMQYGIYVMVLASTAMLVAGLLADVKIKNADVASSKAGR
jgi:hypothetical protein